jgi:hypothetical protein
VTAQVGNFESLLTGQTFLARNVLEMTSLDFYDRQAKRSAICHMPVRAARIVTSHVSCDSRELIVEGQLQGNFNMSRNYRPNEFHEEEKLGCYLTLCGSGAMFVVERPTLLARCGSGPKAFPTLA